MRLLSHDELQHTFAQQDHEELGGAVEQESDVPRDPRSVLGEHVCEDLDHERGIRASQQDARDVNVVHVTPPAEELGGKRCGGTGRGTLKWGAVGWGWAGAGAGLPTDSRCVWL